ncbi:MULTISPECIES: 4'-phosphopantetheinyl transferase family protein [Pantoea]|uniref:4'-phosphopantetheinyl transferase family protein n=1 Tax=Pantoea TaxID=53335 RepID=UPI001F2DFC20|nr:MULTISPECIES: 4'-phosphopantetheinyl transferase superfamily protein [Pantoea]UIL53610.1 4'-phosphopantetheinyl transferase superfamily protein [Pantoea agglomerans]
MRYPDVPLPPPAGGFILSQHLSDSDPWLAVSRFNPQHYRDALATAWGIPLPDRLTQAVNTRRAEYLASRQLARTVMARLGIDDFILTNAPDRSPCWPDDVQASLSHSAGVVALAVTRQPGCCIGVDVEQLMSEATANETAELLMTSHEQQRLRALPIGFNAAATLLFSLKESLYKALWPQLHQPMDFQQAVLETVDLSRQCATLRLTDHFSDRFTQGTTLQAEFLWREDSVITLLTHQG